MTISSAIKQRQNKISTIQNRLAGVMLFFCMISVPAIVLALNGDPPPPPPGHGGEGNVGPTETTGEADAEKSSIAADPTEDVVADGTASSTITITVLDANDDPVAEEDVFFAVTAGSGVLSSGPWSTDVNGKAVATLTSTVAGTVTVTGYLGTDAGGSSVGTVDVEFIAGDADAGESSIEADPEDNVVADGTASSQITITVLDANENPVEGQDVFFAVTDGSGTLSASPWTTNASGQASATLTSTTAETVTVTGYLGTDDQGASVGTAQVTFSAGAADAVSVQTQPEETTAGEAIEGPPAAHVKDAFDNPVASVNVTVSLGGGVFFSGTETVATEADGIATFSDLVINAVGTYTLVFDAAGVTEDATSNEFTVVAGVADAGQSDINADPTTGIVADGPDSSTITITVIDANDNPVEGQDVFFAVTDGSGTLSASPWTTNASGQASATLTSTTAETVTVTGYLGADDQGASVGTALVTFIAGAADAGQSDIDADPTTGIVADGSDSSTITIRVLDANENPVAEEDVFFAVTDGSGVLSSGPWTTDVDGKAVATLTSAVAETVTVTGYLGADDQGESVGTVDVTFVAEGDALTATASQTKPVSCKGGDDGEATAEASGGIGNYSYEWRNLTTQTDLPSQTDAIAAGLSAGEYMVTVRDEASGVVTATVTITEPAVALSAEATVSQHVSCYNGNDGEASVNAEGGWNDYTYLWNDPAGQTTAAATNLAAGNYEVIVTDVEGCVVTATVTVDQPDALTISLNQKTDVTCNGWSDGAITVNAPAGGAGGYSYSWTGPGGFTASQKDISNLYAGNYVLTVTDENDCEVTLPVTITQPGPLRLTVLRDQTICNETAPARLTISASGETGNYSYQWNEDEDNDEVWNVIGGSTANNYQPRVLEGSWWQINRYHYRLRLRDETCDVTIYDEVTITVNPPLPLHPEVPEDIPPFPDFTEVTGTDHDYHCYEADITITVNNYTAEVGSEVDIIAGHNITIPPGTHLKHGANVYLRTTNNCTFCRAVELMSMEKNMLDVTDDTVDDPDDDILTTTYGIDSRLQQVHDLSFRMYPNPTRDLFTLEIAVDDNHQPVEVQIFALRGEMVHKTLFSGTDRQVIDLTHVQPGIYIVRVAVGQQVAIGRIVRH